MITPQEAQANQDLANILAPAILIFGFMAICLVMAIVDFVKRKIRGGS